MTAQTHAVIPFTTVQDAFDLGNFSDAFDIESYICKQTAYSHDADHFRWHFAARLFVNC